MGVHPPFGAAHRHRGRQPRSRGCGRDHDDGVTSTSGAIGLAGGRIVRRGDAGGSRGVRGSPEAQRGRPVVSRRGWAIAILAAWGFSLGWLIKRTYFRSTGQRLAEAALAVPPSAVFYRITVGAPQIGLASTTIDTLPDTVRGQGVLVGGRPAPRQL